MRDLDHILVLLAALVILLTAYTVLVIVHGSGGEFLPPAVLAMAAGITGYAANNKATK